MLKYSIFLFLLLSFFSCIQNKISYIDPERLSKIDKIINEEIEKNNIPGAVLLVGNEKKVIYQKAYGIKNPETKEEYKIDDIFRIASMTKAITSIAVIKLWEEGKIGLDDPIEKYIPEFKDTKILKSFNQKDSTFTVEKALKKITIRQLLTHTSGIGYDFIDRNPSIGEAIKKLSVVPIHHEPGEKFTYGIGLDVLGYMIEIVSGKKLNQFFKEEIFDPLNMNDTYFYLPDEKADRLVPVQTKNNEDWEIFQDNRFNVNYPIEGAKKFFAGGCGLSSTLKDYYNFLSVFINEGKFNGKQFISKKTNELIFENQLPEKFNFGVGLAFGVVLEKDLKNGGTGSEGTISWGGYWNTSFFADPKEKVIGLIFKQTQNTKENTSDLFKRNVFSSVVN